MNLEDLVKKNATGLKQAKKMNGWCYTDVWFMRSEWHSKKMELAHLVWEEAESHPC